MPEVTFQSDEFEKLTAAQHAINDMLGHDVAEWVHAEMKARGFRVDEVIAEDYGFGFWLERAGSHYWIWCSRYFPTDNDDDAVWTIGAHFDPGCLGMRWLRKRPIPATLDTIVLAIHDIVSEAPHTRNITWWRDDLGRGDSSSEPPLSTD
jgi:hypothetical protein